MVILHVEHEGISWFEEKASIAGVLDRLHVRHSATDNSNSKNMQVSASKPQVKKCSLAYNIHNREWRFMARKTKSRQLDEDFDNLPTHQRLYGK
ncbi:hypothetical protein BCT11_04030 [Vibrio sp. 10N.222.52.B12]|nr:hypothetical protein BCT11_04030 [Vibrio sp. 10N.222.52.B12]